MSSEIFLIPYQEEKYIIYAPLKQLAILVTPKVVNLLNKVNKNSRSLSPDSGQKSILDLFTDLGLINKDEEKIYSDCQREFLPNFVTLFLTTKCNMRCIYCYASGGEKERSTLQLKVGKAAIDFIVKNSLSQNKKVFGVGFHGGGEPTLAWEVLQGCVEHSKTIARKENLKVNFSLATNGVMPKEKLNWILEYFNGISLSLDGPRGVQNYNRPMADGSGSFAKVMETVVTMNEKKFFYGIRATITNRSVAYMDRIVDFFGETCKPKRIHFEPTFACGRCLSTGISSPSPEEFISGFRKASKVAEKMGLSLFYSGARLKTITTSFCKASGNSFCVTPEGDVTSCYEVCSKDDPRSAIFFYGKYDSARNDFIFDNEKLSYLRKRTVNNIPFCEDCFCKYHCAGDCLAKASDGKDLLSINNADRCKINQTLTLDQIIKILKGGKDRLIRG